MTESPKIIELQQKFEDNPPRYFASLANEYRKAGEFQRAISICLIYLEKQPEHLAGNVVLGQALHATGKVDEAAEIFRTVIVLDPENLIALKCMGDIAQANGDLVVAHDNFRRVLTADPRDHDTNGRLKIVEQAMKVAAEESAQDWIPPRISGEFAAPEDSPPGIDQASASAEIVEPEPQIQEPQIQEPEPQIQEPEPEIQPHEPVEDGPLPDQYFDEGPVSVADLAEAAPDGSPQPSLEVDNLPALEPPVTHEDVPDDDFVDTLMPDSETEHHSAIAEPVALESSEESLAVPDLMEQAGETVAQDDNFQYRTAEFSLPSYGASDSEAADRAGDMESEAEAPMGEAEIPAPPPTEDGPPHFDEPMRTGEYSLSADTEDWNQESAEPAAPAGPFITETVAELYLQQGFTGEALLVYRQLARAKPDDERIADRIVALEERLANEHTVRQAALDTTSVPEPVYEPDAAFEEIPVNLPVIPAGSPPSFASQDDDWFATPDVVPARTRQTVQEFFAVLGRAKPEIRRKPERIRVTADEIRAAADITAGFGAFGTEPQHSQPRAIPEARSGEPGPQDDVLRFRAWLDGLSDS